MNRRQLAPIWLTLTILVVMAAVLAELYATPWGAWGYSDTSAYVVAARGFLAHGTLSLPQPSGENVMVTLTPPLYPLLLSLGGSFGLDPLDFARWLNALLCAGLLGGAAWGMRRATGSAIGALLWTILLACSPVLFANAVAGMSEELFLLLALGGLLLLSAPERLSPRTLALGAAALALAACTRYAGSAFLLAGGLIVFARLPGRFWTRAGRAVLFTASAALLPLLWLGWTYAASGSLGARAMSGSFGLALGRWGEYLSTTLNMLSGWVPYATRLNQVLPPVGKLAGLGLAWAGLLVYLWRADPGGSRCPGARRLVLAGLLSSALYLLFVGLSYASSDIAPDLIARIYSPLYACLSLALAASAVWLARVVRKDGQRGPNWVWVGASLLVGITAVYQSPQLIEMARRGHDLGVGYTEKFWRNAPVFAFMRGRVSQPFLISNEPGLLLLYSGRAAYSWDELVRGNLETARVTPPGSGNSRLDEMLRSGHAALVIFPERAEEEYGPQASAWLKEWLKGLTPLYEEEDAGVYRGK